MGQRSGSNTIISVASGKGGTGKTTVAVNMALSLENIQLLDCDVEEPNAHLLLQPEICETHPVYTRIPAILTERCDFCGQCSTFCVYNALFVAPGTIMVFPELCHSCGGCALVCPNHAIAEGEHPIGSIKTGRAKGIDLVSGELNVGEPMAVPVIREVKRQIQRKKTVLIDAPPGTACPVVASVYGSDYCLLVTEPTPFGLHDLRITVEVLRELGIPLGVVVNCAGIGDTAVYGYCREENIPILLEIPFSRRIAELYSRGIPFVEELPGWKQRFQHLYHEVVGRVAC
jgi:MinD superfamily P-loop ATPase